MGAKALEFDEQLQETEDFGDEAFDSQSEDDITQEQQSDPLNNLQDSEIPPKIEENTSNQSPAVNQQEQYY